MLTIVKLALRRSDTAFDSEIQQIINDCISELTMLGIYRSELADDTQIIEAVILYAKWHFGQNEDSEKFREYYYDKIQKLMIAKEYGAYGQE